MRKGSLLIHGDPVITGAGCPMRTPPWPPVAGAATIAPAAAPSPNATASTANTLMDASSSCPEGPRGPLRHLLQKNRVAPANPALEAGHKPAVVPVTRVVTT